MSFNARRWLLAILAIPVLLLCGLYFYLQSGSFRQSVSIIASDALGNPVELGGDIDITGLFPALSFSIPSAKVRFAENSSALQRARLLDIRVSVSPTMLVSRGASGNIGLQVGRASFIASSAQGDDMTAVRTSRDLNVVAIRESLSALSTIVDGLSEVHVSVVLDDLDVIMRDAQQDNARYRIKDLSLDIRGNALAGTARVLWDDLAEQRLSVNISDLLLESPGNSNGVSGTLRAELTPSVGRHSAGQVDASFGMDDGGFELGQLDVSNDWLWMRGDVSGSWGVADMQVRAELELRSLELAALTAQSDPDSTGGAVNPNTSAGRLFSYDLFSVSLPLNVEAEVVLHLGAIRLDAMPVANGSLDITLADGVLQVISDELYLLGGESSLSLEMDNTLAQLVALQMKLTSDNLDLSRIRLAGNDDTVISRGTADAIIALKGEGPSPGHIAASLDGYVLASISGAEVNQKYSTLVDRGMVSWALEKVSVLSTDSDDNPSRPSSLSDPLALDCASLRVYINDGRVEVSNGAIMEFPDNTLFSSGFVDLASEQLGFAFRTRSRGLFDLSAISIIKYAEVSGTLLKPRFALNTVELAKQGVKSASSAAWGPLPSLVYSLAEAGVKNASASECTPEIK